MLKGWESLFGLTVEGLREDDQPGDGHPGVVEEAEDVDEHAAGQQRHVAEPGDEPGAQVAEGEVGQALDERQRAQQAVAGTWFRHEARKTIKERCTRSFESWGSTYCLKKTPKNRWTFSATPKWTYLDEVRSSRRKAKKLQ